MATSKGKKNAKVKWAIGADEPDLLPDFQSNDDILKKNKGALPPKGRTRILVKKVTSKENKNGDQMLTVTCEIAEKGSKKEEAFNGYTMWERLNVTEQGKPYLNRFLIAIGASWKDFVSKTVADETEEPMVITKIGTVKLDRPVEAWASVKHGTDQNDEEVAEVGRFLPPPEDEPEDDEETEEEDEDIEVDDEDDADDDDEDSDEDDEDDDEATDEDDDEEDEEDEEDDDDEDAEATLREELSALKLPALKKRALRAGAESDDLPGKKSAIVDLIVELELDEEDDEEDEDDEDDEADGETPEEMEARIKAELKTLDLTELRNRARLNGRKAKELKGAKKPALVKMIMEDEVPPF